MTSQPLVASLCSLAHNVKTPVTLTGTAALLYVTLSRVTGCHSFSPRYLLTCALICDALPVVRFSFPKMLSNSVSE